MAVYSSQYPKTVGPVRSARISDIELLRQYGRVAFAYSGVQTKMLPVLSQGRPHRRQRRPRRARLPPRLQPHRPGQPVRLAVGAAQAAPARPAKAVDVGFTFDDAVPAGGTPVTRVTAPYPATQGAVHLERRRRALARGDERRKAMATEGGQLGGTTVIIQYVTVTRSIYHDFLGNYTPLSRSVGTGTALFLRDGQYWKGHVVAAAAPPAAPPGPSAASPSRWRPARSGSLLIEQEDPRHPRLTPGMGHRGLVDGVGFGRRGQRAGAAPPYHEGTSRRVPATRPRRPARSSVSSAPSTASDARARAATGTARVKRGMAEMLKGGVIMDVVTPEQAKIAEDAGAVAVMALERVPADIRRDGGVARMSDPDMIDGIIAAVSIPVMAKARIGHFVEAQVLQSLGVDYVDESEVLTPADESHHIDKWAFTVPFVCGATNLGEALRRIAEGAAMIRSKGEAGTGNVVEATRHMRQIRAEIRRLATLDETELYAAAKELRAPYELVKEIAETGKLPVVLFTAGGIATPADAAMMMQLGAEGVFVGSGIFKSGNPAQRAEAIVKATTFYDDPDVVAKVSRGLGEAMVGINIDTLPESEKFAGRGW